MAKTIRLKTNEVDPTLKAPLRLGKKHKGPGHWRYFPKRTSFEKLVTGEETLAAAKTRPGSGIRIHSKIKIGVDRKTPTTAVSIDSRLVLQRPAVQSAQSALVHPINLELTLTKTNP